jgi:hypothetical protein
MNSTALYHKYKNTKIQEIYEIILQWYLISTGYRNVALVYVKSISILEKIMRFLKKNNISYRIFDEKHYTDLVLFNPKKFTAIFKKSIVFSNKNIAFLYFYINYFIYNIKIIYNL